MLCATCYVLRTTYYVLRTTYYVLRTAYCVLRPTYYAGALLDLSLDTRVTAAGDLSTLQSYIEIDYLKSYEGHGTVLVRCVRGCACAETRVDAHAPDQQASTFGRHVIQIDGRTSDCGIQLLVADATSSGRHKFKVRLVDVLAK